MSEPTVVLSPAQSGFLQRHLPQFNGTWKTVIAAGAGSERRFLRLQDPVSKETRILIVWDSRDRDWQRFVGIQKELDGVLDLLPRIYAVDDRRSLILEEDLGSKTLNRFCVENAGNAPAIDGAYRRVADSLVQWQAKAGEASPSLRTRSMDEEMFLWESEYFALHCVSEYFGLEDMLDQQWETERRALASAVAGLPKVAIHRDFQSENIMLSENGVKFVDFQGARLGPAGYDLASLLYDPYVDFLAIDHADGVLAYYNSVAPVKLERDAFLRCAVQRLMQALGAYGNLSLHKGKDRYQAFIPVTLMRLARVLGECPGLPVAKKITDGCIGALR